MTTPNIKLLTELNKVIEKNGYTILEHEIRPARTKQNIKTLINPLLITEFAGDIVIKLVLNKCCEQK